MDECPQCGNEYKQIASHWSMSSCDYPQFNQQQKETITGLLMGDGSINTANKNPYLQVNMISPNYLEFVDDEFGIFGNGVNLFRTAEESARESRESEFSPNARAKNYSDLYRWQSMCHPQLQRFVEWYETGKKVWPADIKLTPTVLKHWYCGDGNWSNTGSHNRIKISMSNEIDNTEKVDKIFENVGLPSPSNYAISERKNGSGKICNAEFTVSQSKELWEYMGKPLPDFEYKWPEQYRQS